MPRAAAEPRWTAWLPPPPSAGKVRPALFLGSSLGRRLGRGAAAQAAVGLLARLERLAEDPWAAPPWRPWAASWLAARRTPQHANQARQTIQRKGKATFGFAALALGSGAASVLAARRAP
mmetsp:Transcript_14968/g.39573  ORF Transcript_14968/g.39573 Transcript_14968/m.39573 type:complete len:120 (-) Transcript_14968:858-1217(-)